MVMMMRLATSQAVMGRFRTQSWLAWGGWGATAVMAITVVAMLVSFVV